MIASTRGPSAAARLSGRISPDINVTPLIDILLVMLVIFLAALPLTQQGFDANVPNAVSQPHEAAPTDQLVIEYGADRRLAVNKQPVEIGALESTLRELFRTRRDKTLYVMGDESLHYGDIARVIDAAKGAGVNRVGIVTDSMRRAAAGR